MKAEGGVSKIWKGGRGRVNDMEKGMAIEGDRENRRKLGKKGEAVR